MKLDNIIYDVDSLAAAIKEQWNTESDTFKALFPSDTATFLVNGFAAYGAMLQYMLVSAMANCYTETAFSEAAIYQLANTLGNDLHGNNSAQVKVKLTKQNFKGINTIIPAETLFEIQGKKFFNSSAIIIPANNEVVSDIILTQGEVLESNHISSGIPNEKFYFASDFKANNNMVRVFVNGQEWEVTDSFIPYDKNYVLDSSALNVVVLKTDPDGQSYIKVGDNQLGNMPSADSNIQIRYVSNDGTNGNMSETDLEGTLLTSLVYTDNFGNQDTLKLEVLTTSTAYGGFGKQSLEILRQTSPYVFASGHRAIRRQDYNALLQNKCGYLTSSVWGEYEEANKVGAYDSIMMNMVYYTGLKSFETYPYFEIGNISDPTHFESALYSSRGFWGSYNIRIQNLKNTVSPIVFQDSGAKGQLFINSNAIDPRDSILPDWINSMQEGFEAVLPMNYIVNPGKLYSVNDELYVNNTNNEITLRIKEIGTGGKVKKIELLKRTASQQWTPQSTPESDPDLEGGSNPVLPGFSGELAGETLLLNDSAAFSTSRLAGSSTGTGLQIYLNFERIYYSNLITTNDDRGDEAAPDQDENYKILSARSDKPNGDTAFYESLYTPTLLNPVQIILTYEDTVKSIVGIKFKATNPANGPFPGTVAMFGTNEYPMPSLENIRNSKDWDCLINRTYLSTPWNNNNDNWTDWIPTNCFKQTMDLSGKPEFEKYKYYVIEFYSCENTDLHAEPHVTIDTIKMMYSEDSSVIYYEDNGKLNINLPTAGSPGPESSDGYLTNALINSADYPLYSYEIKLDGITSANGYRNGNVLAYVFKNEETNTELPFLINVINVDNGTYTITLNGNSVLTGTEYIKSNAPIPLANNPVYNAYFVPETGTVPLGNGGSGYRPNDIVALNGTNGELKVRIATVNSEGTALSVVWNKSMTISKNYGPTDGSESKRYETTLVESLENSSGSGLVLDINTTLLSGANGVPGTNGTVSISSINNLQVQANFVGNRIDSQDINYLDQPIINKFNHFTTFLEFKQPEITQVGISAVVSLDINASITSGTIIQNIKNNILKLFEITPDYIGKGLKISDIYAAIKNTPNVKWCKVTSPTDNIDIPNNNIMISSFINITETVEEFK